MPVIEQRDHTGQVALGAGRPQQPSLRPRAESEEADGGERDEDRCRPHEREARQLDGARR